MFKKLILFFVLILITCLVGYWAKDLFFSLSSAHRATMITILGSIIAVCFTHSFTKSREIQSRHFGKKTEAYETIFEIVFDQLQKAKMHSGGTKKDQAKQLLSIIEAKKKIMIWGSPKVIQRFNEMETASILQDSKNASFYCFGKLFEEIRRDLGHNDTSLKDGELMSLIILPEDKDKVKEQFRIQKDKRQLQA
ncbi:MAG: hypothetical protein ACERJ1_18010 [Halodesulfovibrio sp.]|uniref:hypothetical protein n=1 Tax=Halodesulfovibrio sp. TaxID=1912772 RepID=UPI00359E7780